MIATLGLGMDPNTGPVLPSLRTAVLTVRGGRRCPVVWVGREHRTRIRQAMDALARGRLEMTGDASFPEPSPLTGLREVVFGVQLAGAMSWRFSLVFALPRHRAWLEAAAELGGFVVASVTDAHADAAVQNGMAITVDGAGLAAELALAV